MAAFMSDRTPEEQRFVRMQLIVYDILRAEDGGKLAAPQMVDEFVEKILALDPPSRPQGEEGLLDRQRALLEEVGISLKRIAYGGSGPEGRFLTAAESRGIAHTTNQKVWQYLKDNPKGAALLSPPQEGLWRPISEAPRDGTPILYWEPGCVVAETVCFLDGFKIAEHGWYPYAGGNWHIAQGREHQDAVWQPLPAPPALSNQGKPSS